MPERVRELAETITEKQESVYEKTKAIERYFGRNGFVYTQAGCCYPEGQAMIMSISFFLIRKRATVITFPHLWSLCCVRFDIPARWVKGFAPGEFVLNEDGEKSLSDYE